MASIKSQNPVGFNLDTMQTKLYGVFRMNEGSELDFTNFTKVSRFIFEYSQPKKTFVYVLFSANDSKGWFSLDKSGNADYPDELFSPEFTDLELYGNTISELVNLTDIPAFVGKKILAAIGLCSEDPDNAIPKVKFSVHASSDSQIMNTSELSPVYNLGEEAMLADIQCDSSCTGSGAISLTAQGILEDGSVTGFLPLTELTGRKLSGVQIKADYSVKDFQSTAKINSLRILSKTESSIIVNGDGAASGEIISCTQDWFLNVNHCRMNIRHSPLNDSKIEAYVSIRKRPADNRGEQLGIGSGKKTTYQLKNKNKVKYDSVKLYFDDVQVISGFEFNAQVGRITCTPPEGVIVSCDYESDWDSENWQKMNLTERYSLDDYDVSEFRFSRPEDDSENKSVCAVKIVIVSSAGHSDKENVGNGTGISQTYRLNHKVRDGNITLYDNGAVMDSRKYSLKEDPQYISIACANGHVITASYDWVSESPEVYQFISVFSE